MLLCFEVVLGLRVNLAKSEIVPVEELDGVAELARVMGFKVGSLPMNYLGLSLGSSLNHVRCGTQ